MGRRRLCPSSGPGREDGEMGGGWGGWGGAQRPLPNIPQWATGTTAGQPHKRSKNSETARTPGLNLNIFPKHYRFKGHNSNLSFFLHGRAARILAALQPGCEEMKRE